MKSRLLSNFNVTRKTTIAALVAAFVAVGASPASAATHFGYCDGSDGARYSRIEFFLDTDDWGVPGFSFNLNLGPHTMKLGKNNNVDMTVFGKNTGGQVVKLGQTWYSGDDIRSEVQYNISYRIPRPHDVKEAWAVFHATFDRPHAYDFQCWKQTSHRHW